MWKREMSRARRELDRVVRCTNLFIAARPRKHSSVPGMGPRTRGHPGHGDAACGPIAPDPSPGKPAEGKPKRGGELRSGL